MKILLIEDDTTVVVKVAKALKDTDITVTPFEPASHEREKIYNQIKQLCKKNQFDFVLLDYELWHFLTGDLYVDIFHNAEIPFIGFSSKYDNNNLFMQLGAIDYIAKDRLYDSRGFDETKFTALLMEIIKNFKK